jgi:ribulose kinase
MTTLAGAICSAKASNHYPDLLSASESLKVKTQKLEPNLKYRDYYLEKFQQYLETTKILTPTFHELTAKKSVI